MAEFYQALAAVYDDIFPLSPTQVAFVRSQLPPVPCNLIDLGCSTGALARELAADGYDVWGVDLSSQMITQAEAAARAAAESARLSFSVGDMRAIVAAAPPVGSLLCLGNTLVHLTGLDELATFLCDCCQAVQVGGRLILQIVNYDRVAGKRVRELPTLRGQQGNQLQRSYRERADGLLDFVTRLTLADGDVLDSAVALYPLRRSQLQQLLTQAGFAEASFYGTYQGEDWTEDTFHTICVAVRR